MPSSHFRAGVVIVVRRIDTQQVLAFERADSPGTWQLPQGGLKLGERPLQGALRELMEDNKRMAAALRKAHKLADENEDRGTAQLLEAFIDETEKRTWFLVEASRQEGANAA